MKRVLEPELMEEEAQALAYAQADFNEPNEAFVDAVVRRAENFDASLELRCTDLGCGPAEIAIRLAKRFPWTFDAVDGSQAMLDHARTAIRTAGLADRIQTVCARLPDPTLMGPYDIVISNSLLHHLPDPTVLWSEIARLGRSGTEVIVMDLRRPDDAATVDELVAKHAADAPDVLARDFRASLHAAFRVDEVRAQLAAAGLSLEVRATSDRHLLVSGSL